MKKKEVSRDKSKTEGKKKQERDINKKKKRTKMEV